MDNFVNFLTVRNIDAQIYAFWDNAISNHSEQAKNKINELLERNMKRLLTNDYTKQAYRARLVEPQKYSELVLDNRKKMKIEDLFSGPSGINGFPADKMGPPPSPTPGRANDEKMRAYIWQAMFKPYARKSNHAVRISFLCWNFH